MSAPDYRRSTADRVLPLRARRDLESVEVQFGGQSTYVVKDPVSGETYHFTAQEHRLLEALEQPMSLAALQRVLESEFAPQRAKIVELQQFVNRLYGQGLVVSDNPGQGSELKKRGEQNHRKRRLANLVQVLSVRLGGIEAGPIIDRLHGWFGWAFSRPAIFLWLAFVGYALISVLGNVGALSARVPALSELTKPSRLPAWIAAIAMVKVMHELGHAMACRHFGARPREIGVLLLAGAPALYCDVSDAWRLPSKWQRMAVSGGGMFVELVIAAAAALVWLHAEPGLLAALSLSLIVVCSVGTLLINANPLLRYDGYYLLSDWLETPNLAERARGLVSGAWRRWLLGDPPQDDPLVGPHKRRALWVYAIVSKVYTALVLVGIIVVMVKIAKPHHLQNLAYTVAAIALAGVVYGPVAAAVRTLANPSTRGRLRRVRLAATAGLFLGALALVCVLPITRRVTAPTIVVPAKSHPLFAVVAGELEFAAPAGATVAAGDVVARLRNPDLELTVAGKEGEVRERRARVEQLRILQTSLPGAAEKLPTAMAELAAAEAELTEERAMAESLVIRSPVAGRVWGPPAQTGKRSAEDSLPQWSGSPLDKRNRGAWIEPGTPVAVVAEGDAMVAWAGVEQGDVSAVELGQAVRVLADQQPTSILAGRVVQVSRQARDNSPAGARPPQVQAELLGDERYHVVEIELDASDAPLLPGARGTAKIATYRSTAGELVLMQLRRAFQRAM